jgi:cytochrome bd ubiquinol oxidase subunit II
MATPWISATVRERWFAMPQFIALMVIPATTAIALLLTRHVLGTTVVRKELCWLPFVLLIATFLLGFAGLAYSTYPYVVIDRLTMWQAASSPEALEVTLIGVCISVPAIAAYTVFSYRVFRGKATELRYG